MRFALAGFTFAAAVAASGPTAAKDLWVLPEVARACPQHGPGFVQVPGSTACVKIGGRVRAEATAGSRRVSREQMSGFGASGRVTLDARTETDLGPVRTYVGVSVGQRSRLND